MTDFSNAGVETRVISNVSHQWRAGPCLAGEPNSKFGAPLFATVANLLETSISNYLLYESKYKKVGVLSIRIVWFTVSSIRPLTKGQCSKR